ncbi:MAG: superinfection exclusion B family protein [Acidobacteriales bacterium]|nr:superinfection exclusion B family protein [Terriglobales bacterium]
MLLEFIKLAPRYLIAIGLVVGILLFGSDDFRKTLGLTEFTKNYRPILGVLFLSSLALLLVSVGSFVIDRIKSIWRDRKAFQRITKRLHSLTEDEKQILRFYIRHNTRANSLRIQDGIVKSLVSCGIIYRSTQLGDVANGFAHNISEIAWNYLHIHPHLLEGTTTTVRTDHLW